MGGVELLTFKAAEAYVYQDWNVEKWLKQVSLQLFTTSGDEDDGADGAAGGVIRLLEENGELFAECPLPPDTPVNACCEPVVDSSRYYVLRLVDETTKRHAYLGLGFSSRDGSMVLCARRQGKKRTGGCTWRASSCRAELTPRSASSDFRVALAELSQQRERSKEARRRRLAHEESGGAAGAEGEAAASPSAPAKSYSLANDAKITVNVPSLQRKKSDGASAAAAVPLLSPPPVSLKNLSLSPPPAVPVRISIPPPPPSPQQAPDWRPVPIAAFTPARVAGVADDPFGDDPFGEFVHS